MMGWKAVKEHYRIVHGVQLTDDGICIGSPYIHDIIVINRDGKIVKDDDRTMNDDLMRYQAEMKGDPETLRRLVRQEDTFELSIPVYTWRGAEIIEKQCEELGWPNVTHDGEMMYENRFSTDRAKVVAWAKKDARIGIEHFEIRIREAEDSLASLKSALDQERENLASLDAAFPDAITTKGISDE